MVGLSVDFTTRFQVEIENGVFEIDWNEFVLSMPNHQFLIMKSHSLTIFSCEPGSCIPLHAISAALHNTLCTPVSLPFTELSNPFSSYP